MDGGFNCGCEFGFSLGDDRKSCNKGIHKYLYLLVSFLFCTIYLLNNLGIVYGFFSVADICSLFPALNCSYGCKQDRTNASVGYCFCEAGYELNAQDQQTCIGMYSLCAVYIYSKIDISRIIFQTRFFLVPFTLPERLQSLSFYRCE